MESVPSGLGAFRNNGYTGWGSEGFWALAIHRLQKTVRKRRAQWLWAPVRLVLRVVRKLFVLVTLIDIHPDAEIGPGLIIPHGGPIRVHFATKIGADCALHHMCTIGAGPRPGGATIGDHVYIGCHSSVIGAVTVGEGAMIAAKSLVISDALPALHSNRCPRENAPANVAPVGRAYLVERVGKLE